MSVEWFLKLKEIDSLNKMRQTWHNSLKDQNERIAKLNDRLVASDLQRVTLRKDLGDVQDQLLELEKRLKTASEQRQRFLDIGADDQKIATFDEEIENLEESGLELLTKSEDFENQIRDHGTFTQGLQKTISEIQNENVPEIQKAEQEIQNIDIRVTLLTEELPSDFQNLLKKITAKNLAHGPFTRIEQGSCYFCRYKISRIEESEIDMHKGLKVCPQCTRIFLPYGA